MSLNPKAVCRSEAFLRVTGQPSLPAATAASLALAVAATVLPVFERTCPDDDRVHRALGAVAPFAKGEAIPPIVTANAAGSVHEVHNSLRAACQASIEERQRLAPAYEAAAAVYYAVQAVDAAMTACDRDAAHTTRAAILSARNAGMDDADIDRHFAALMQAMPAPDDDDPGAAVFRR